MRRTRRPSRLDARVARSAALPVHVLLERAERHLAAGRFRLGVEDLIAAHRRDPRATEARRRLAEAYRLRGAPDQAGRWGILLEDFVDDRERDRLARLLAAANVDRRDAPRFLEAARHASVPAPVDELYDTLVPIYERRFAHTSPAASDDPVSRFAPIAAALAGFGLVAWTLGGLGVFIAAMAGAVDLRIPARAISVASAFTLGLAASAWALDRLVGRRIVAAVVWAILGVALTAGVVIVAAMTGFQLEGERAG